MKLQSANNSSILPLFSRHSSQRDVHALTKATSHKDDGFDIESQQFVKAKPQLTTAAALKTGAARALKHSAPVAFQGALATVGGCSMGVAGFIGALGVLMDTPISANFHATTSVMFGSAMGGALLGSMLGAKAGCAILRAFKKD